MSAEKMSIEKQITELIKPSYISGGTVLFIKGVKSHTTQAYFCATLFREAFINLDGIKVRYIELPEDYFFGFEIVNGVPTAKPEKALLDQIHYEESIGKRPLLDDIDFDLLDINKLKAYAERMAIPIDEYLQAYTNDT